MKYLYLSIILFVISTFSLFGQEFKVDEIGTLDQVYGEKFESDELLPFNDLNIEFGYVLYQTNINTTNDNEVLMLDNVRDYAAVYVDGVLQGVMTDEDKKVTLSVKPGNHTLQLYANNIGRITYGPEILDNSKGLYGEILLNDNPIEDWEIIVLEVKSHNTKDLKFEVKESNAVPAFHRGNFDLSSPVDCYLDITGWGIGEAWVNGNYIGSYWEDEKQQSIQIPKDYLKSGKNEVVIFEVKSSDKKTLKIVDSPIFK